MKVLVTGGGGFIGRAVVRWLREYGHAPGVFDRPLDVRDVDQLMNASVGADHVIHLAGLLGTHELFDAVHDAIDVNIHGTVNVLDMCCQRGMGYTGITMPPVFDSIYTMTKLAAGRTATAYHKTYGLPVSHVRAFNAYGIGQAHGPTHPQKIVPTFAVHTWKGWPIPVWGDGLQTVDLIDVDTLARILVEACQAHDDQYIDGGTGNALTVMEVVEMTSRVVGRKVAVEHRRMRRGEEPSKVVATGEGWDLLSFRPEVQWTAFGQTVKSYENWHDQ